MTGWNLAEIWEAAAAQLPEAPFARQGDRSITWVELELSTSTSGRSPITRISFSVESTAAFMATSSWVSSPADICTPVTRVVS